MKCTGLFLLSLKYISIHKRVLQKTVISIFVVAICCLTPIKAHATELAQNYIADAPISLEEFANDPLGNLAELFADGFLGQVHAVFASYIELFVFLLLGAIACILLVKTEWISLIELLVAAGSFVIISPILLNFTRIIAEHILQWRMFLHGFIPVFVGVVVASGETVSASLYSGFFLVCINMLAFVIESFLVPLVECYLALSITSAFWLGEELPQACKTLGKLLRKIVSLIGAVFTIVFGIQRVFSAASDGVLINAAKTVSGAVPIVGQTMANTAGTLLASVKVLKTGLGFVAVSVIAYDFIPLYIEGFLHFLLLNLCAILAKLFSLERCGKFFDCIAIAVECVLAILALFFFMVLISTALMVLVGAGG